MSIVARLMVLAGVIMVAGMGHAAPANPAASHKIMTVNGPILPSDLGMTLMHEHIFMDYALPFDRPDLWASAGLRYPRTPEQLTLWNRAYGPDLNYLLSPGWPENRDALVLDDYATALAELKKFTELGGGAIVQMTPKGLHGDVQRLQRLAKESGLQIIVGTAWYQDEWLSDDVRKRSIESLTAELIHDITEGMDGTNIRAGIIGEIGAESHPPADQLTATEINVLHAAARAARATGVAVSLHTLMTAGAPLQPLDIMAAEGLSPDRVIVDHINADVVRDRAYLRALAARGVYLEFDLLGYRESNVRATLLDDYEIAQGIADLIHWGYGDKILLSHDVYSKMQLTKFGGYGYSFIPRYFLPFLKSLGVTAAQIDDIMIYNPRRVLTIAEPLAGK